MNFRKGLAWLLSLIMLIMAFPAGVITVSAENTTEFLGGAGTEESPYLISTKDHLNNVRKYLDAHFLMVADIEFTEADFAEGGAFYNNGQGWEPIGKNVNSPFTGVFDGDGHIVSRLRCRYDYPSNIQYSGLFGRNVGHIKNLGMVNGDMYAETTKGIVYAGGIAGYNSGTISNCYNTDNVFGWTMSASVYAGGIAGYNSGTISNCYNTGNVSGRLIISETIGGKETYVGGIAGYNVEIVGDSINMISDCYNIGYVLGTSIAYDYVHTGGIVGYTSVDESVINCYYLKGSFRGSRAGTVCAESQMTQQETFSDFDFETIWTMEGNPDYLYPELKEVPMQFEKELVSISVTLPNKTKYLEGKDALDVTGGKVILHYDGGTTEAIDMTEDMVSGFKNTQVGIQPLTVTYKGKTATFDVEIVSKSLESIAVHSLPDKLTYLEGHDILNVSGGQLSLIYNNGSRELVPLREDMISGFDNTKVGVQTLTVTYQGMETTFKVEIIAKSLESIIVTILPGFQSVYYEGDPFNPAGLEVTARYDNGTSEIVTDDYDISGYDPTPGTKTITITWQGKSDTVQVTVVEIYPIRIEITKWPEYFSFLEGDEFDPSLIEVTAYFNNGTSQIITDYEVHGYDPTPGNKEITITYRGQSAIPFWVTVAEKTLIGIQVTTPPDKLEYFEYEAFDPTGMVVTAYFNNDTAEVVTDYSLGGFESLVPGTKSIEIHYQSYFATLAVTVRPRIIESVSISRKPSKLTYIEGTLFDDTDMVLLLHYTNGTLETITTGWTTEYDFSTPGQKNITITYGGKQTTLTVTVIAKQISGIAVESGPNKTTYMEGQELDTAGLKLKVSYNNDTEEIVTGNWTITGYDRNKTGIQTITVTYGGKTDSFTVTVKAKSVSSISMKANPSKTTYLTDESLNLAGAKITVKYNNNTQEDVAVTSGMVSGYNANKVGSQTITVTYQGKTTSFKVTVNTRVPSSITSSTYSISSGFISKIGAGTTVTQLLNGINEKAYCKIYKGNSEVAGSTPVGTGMEIRLLDGATVKQTLTIVVTGDTNGDGGITITDMLAVKSHLLKKTTLSGAAAKAADTSGDKAVSITDFIQIKAHILGKDKVQPQAC